MPNDNANETVTVIIRGKHDTGRTTLASLIRDFLRETGYANVKMQDSPPLADDQKPEFQERFRRNRMRPVVVKVELDG